ncbi:acyl-CoA binding protein [Flavobacterium sp. 103]|uniref:Phosphatidylserine decarboxylase n=1 Tax=Flavobacterium aquariorum TaxID=2217670 RepID=A0A2W7TXM7_9FLAO|nr:MULTISPECIES: acyl-CoA-binding protein [Flavobacterium]PVX47095.1 acyl-CoA binding protein [Flavobacterium sp. 103]PZX94798.1 phosphatidylserine decarboxylase [Flavobacterium aquariorum]QKJ64365.1 acyl-CoA-binding protein [Flavobacterium sp. M31R6]
MIEKDLDKQFLEAVEIASFMTQASLPQDVQLRLYAFYKHATFDRTKFTVTDNSDLRNAFKTNAWIQISHLTQDEAKQQYIELIHSLIK